MTERNIWGLVSERQNQEKLNTKLTTILPYFIVGPPLCPSSAYPLGPGTNSSCDAISQILYNKMPVYPNVSLPMVDVRDVARAHISAALDP